MTTTIRRAIIQKHEQPKTNLSEKEIKRQRLVKQNQQQQQKNKPQYVYSVFVSSAHLTWFVLCLTHPASYLEQNVVSRKKEEEPVKT